ncbi:MAG: hypothetical protein CMB80_01145 [Flammeovirgaceae bacterium]|nr:hypothetical protein [Flammeovirgaceae bacterium]|tara:strand:- start:1931 stop:2275 length:345 start_codon:yes stop_codon:yes gene_type:complete
MQDGTVVSNRKDIVLSKEEVKTGEITRGIHVYRQKMIDCDMRPKSFVVPVYGERGDFIATSRNDAVFVKIRVDFKELEQAIRVCVDRLHNDNQWPIDKCDELLAHLLKIAFVRE